ncbi:PilZ domain-containing protein, partial [Thermodesulfobacteriota bacterium]
KIYLMQDRGSNFDKNGLYFETNIQLVPGKEIYLGFDELPSGSRPHIFHAEILWIKRLTKSIYNYGYGAKHIHGSYTQKPEESDLAEKAELRKNARRRFCKSVFLILINDYFQGTSKNISRGGIFVETRNRFSMGAIIKLVIPGTKIDNGVVLKGEIVRINQIGIGVKFTNLIRSKTAQKRHHMY